MTNLPASFVFLSLATGTLSLAFCIFVFEVKNRKKNTKDPNHSLPQTNDNNQNTSVLIAEKEAQDILKKAQIQAREIVSQAKSFNKETIEDIDKTLSDIKLSEQSAVEEISEDILLTYRKIIEDTRNDAINIATTASKTLQNDAIKEVDSFKSLLSRQTSELQKIVAEKIDSSYQTAQKELEVYKLTEMKKIDTQVTEILSEVSKEVLGKTIPLENHHKLIIDSLEKAKKEGIFNYAKK